MTKQLAMIVGVIAAALLLSIGAPRLGADAPDPGASTSIYDSLQLPSKATAPMPVDQRHWAEDSLKSLAAESKPEQSLYLSAIQYVTLEEKRGDISAAIPKLEDIAKRATNQAVRNAIRRVIVDICLETGDFEAAEKVLQVIVNESLIQN